MEEIIRGGILLKRIISVLLVLAMSFTFIIPAFAGIDFYATKSRIPVIVVSGDGGTIVDKDGKELSKLTKFFTNKGGEVDKDDDEMSNIISSAANVVWPLLYGGLVTGNYEPYYESLQKELSELFGDIILDENGEASNGSGIDGWAKWKNGEDMVIDRLGDKGYYGIGDYQFYYDWRLDPIHNADILNNYIKGVKNVTGAPKVAVLCRCVGTSVVMAYLEKYGTDDICGLGMDGAVCMGAEPISEGISGKFKIDGDAIERILLDGNQIGLFNIDPLIIATLDLAEKSGVIDGALSVARETIYKELVKGVTSAFTLSSISYPCYWACVKPEDFDTALEYVFGEEGSEKRIKYAGLIEKITAYNEKVKKHIPEILKSVEEDGVKVAVIAKYGLQLIPTCESRNVIADSFVSTESSSFGATTGTVYRCLSNEYIASQREKGLEKYISPDKQVDASTCAFPDYTWFVKGVKHSEWTNAENQLLITAITADRQLSVDDFDETQFMVRDKSNPGRMVAMTTENCNTENWVADEKNDKPTDRFEFLFSFIKSVISWFKLILKRINLGTILK